MWRIKTPSGPRQTTLLLSDKLAYSYDRATVKIYGNVVKATHGETKNEVLGSGDGSQELQQFTLLQSPLTYLAAPTPAGAESTLQVRVNDVLWHETDNLVGLSPKERSFVTSANDSDKTTVQFGDGEFGARLPTGVENVKAVYRVGIGAPGNVKAGQITSVITKPLGVKEVVNPLAASGGAGREEFAQARQNAPLAVMALDRLVSVQDYADFARTYAGIAKASATRISDGRRQLIHVTVAGNDDVPIDTTSDLYVNLRRALLVNGDPYQVLQLAVRKLKLLVISARVRLLPDYLWDAVEPKIRAAIADKFSFGTRDLAQSAFASEALSVIQAIPEVAYVDLDVFDAVAEDTSPQGLANLGSTLKLQPRILVYGARVERKVTDPAKRILPAELAYLNPTVADTLILTEISG
jgi:predicted phage baseplate assembly protein